MARFEKPIHFVGLFLFVAVASTALIMLVRADAKTRHDHGKEIKIPEESIVIILQRKIQKLFSSERSGHSTIESGHPVNRTVRQVIQDRTVNEPGQKSST